jgi:YggT family protein
LIVLCYVLELYLLALILRIVLSWFPVSGSGFMASVQGFLFTITEPVLGPLRSILPPVRLGAVALDLSPLVVLIGLQIVIAWVCGGSAIL